MLRFIVTGAAGFVGSHLSRQLRHQGHDVIGIDAFRDYYSVELKSLRVSELLGEINFRNIDLLNFDLIDNLIQKFNPHSIFHLAAQPGVRLPIDKSERYIQDNVVSHCNILKSAVINKVPKFLYASSSSVYGNDARAPFSESEMNLKPVSLYGSTKLATEIITPNFVKGSDTVARGMRFFTVYGPWGRPDMAYFRIITRALNGGVFELFGDGNIRRDFTYITDIVQSIVLLEESLNQMKGGSSDIINIGGGRPHSMNQLIEAISKITGRAPKVVEQDKITNDSLLTFCDTTLLEKLINFKPQVELDQGITATIDWANKFNLNENLENWIKSTQ